MLLVYLWHPYIIYLMSLQICTAQDINRLNEDLEELSSIHDLENTPNVQSNEHASSVKKCLQSNLKGTAESFAAVLQMRADNLQRQVRVRAKIRCHFDIK